MPLKPDPLPLGLSKTKLLGAGFVLCLLELFIIQAQTLHYPGEPVTWTLFGQSVVRLVWDASICALLVLTMHRTALALLFVGQFIFFNIVVLYHSYFKHPLSLVDGLRNVSESMLVAPHSVSIIDLRIVSALFALLLLKLLLVGGAGERPSERGLASGARRRFVKYASVGGAGALAVGLVTAPHETNQSLVSRYGPALGYMVPTAFDATLPYSDRMLARAIEAGRHSSDRLTPVETPISVGSPFVIIQVESLDYGVIDFDIGGVAVTPYLRSLRDRSLFYKLEAIHIHGSADADFVAMMGRLPSPDTIAYYVDGYPYDDALPHFLSQHGYDTRLFLHGVEGNFFGRRNAFNQMGFSEILFEEDLLSEYGLKKRPSDLGIEDASLFRTAQQALLKSVGKSFAFLITVTSHGPFTSLPPDAPRLIANPSSAAERYFNSIHYVDGALREFIEGLPDGATVVIYGDHTSQVDFPGYEPGVERRREFVPLYIHQTGENLAEVQATRNLPLARTGDVTFIDVSAFLRARIAAGAPTIKGVDASPQ